jgi:hypothetical protein
MKKTFLLFSLLAITSGPALAQRTVVSGTITDPNGLPYSQASVRVTLSLPTGALGAYLNGAQIAGSVGPVATDNTGSFLVQLADNTLIQCANAQGQLVTCAPQTQWAFSATLSPGVAPPLGTGPQTCNATITISGASQNVSSNFVCPALSVSSAGASPNGSTIYAWAPTYGLKATAKFVCDAAFTNNSTTVTTPATDRPFLATDSFAVVWGSNASCNGDTPPNITTLVGTGVSATFVNAHTVTLSAAATGTCTQANNDGCVFVWGPDDTTAMQNAWNAAAAACGTLVLPAGDIILQSLPFFTAGTALCPTSPGIFILYGLTVYGQGPLSTTILLSPAITLSASTSLFGSSANFSTTNRSFHDFGVAAFTSATAPMSGGFIFDIFFNSTFYNMFLQDVFPSSANMVTTLRARSTTDGVTSVHSNIFYNSGEQSIGGGNGGDGVIYFDNNIQGFFGLQTTGIVRSHDNWISHNNTSLTTVGGTNGFSDRDNFLASTGTFGVQTPSASASYQFLNTRMTGTENGGGATFFCQSTDTCIVGGEASLVTNSGTGSAILNAGTLTLRNATLTNSGGGVTLSNSGTVIFKEGNSFLTGNITNTGVFQVVDGEGGYQGACTGVVTSATTVGLYGLGQTAATTCTSTTVASGRVMTKTGKVYALYCTATAGNQAADACTVVKNGAAQTMTCSLNAAASCTDGTVAHQVSFVQGDILGIEVIGGTGTTLANVKGTLVTN